MYLPMDQGLIPCRKGLGCPKWIIFPPCQAAGQGAAPMSELPQMDHISSVSSPLWCPLLLLLMLRSF